MKKWAVLMGALAVALVAAESLRARSWAAGPKVASGIRDVIIVFTNSSIDDADRGRDAAFFFSRDEVLEEAKAFPGFAKRNGEFHEWLTTLKEPGFNVYGEGFEDDHALLARLLKAKKGWVCCGQDGEFWRGAELKVKPAESSGKKKSGAWYVAPYDDLRLYPVAP